MKRFLLAVALLFMLVLPPAAAAADDHEQIQNINRRTERGTSTEASAGVSVEGLKALVAVGGRNVPTGGGRSSCGWGVAFNPNQDRSVNTGNHFTFTDRRRAEGLPLGDGESLYRSQLEGRSDASRLRYVYNYGSGCGQLVAAWITVADIEAVAQLAFDDLQQRWPAQDVALGWPEPVEDTWTALRTSLAWEPISATATDGGITVTVTATPAQAVWDIGEVNGRYGGTTEVVCDGPGDMPMVQEAASCKVWYAGPSTGLTDVNGSPNVTDLGLTVVWNVGYTSTFASDPSWLIWPTISTLDGLRVVTSQSVNVTGGS